MFYILFTALKANTHIVGEDLCCALHIVHLALAEKHVIRNVTHVSPYYPKLHHLIFDSDNVFIKLSLHFTITSKLFVNRLLPLHRLCLPMHKWPQYSGDDLMKLIDCQKGMVVIINMFQVICVEKALLDIAYVDLYGSGVFLRVLVQHSKLVETLFRPLKRL